MKRRIIVGVSGASGVVLALDLLSALKDFPEVETHLVITPSALRTLELETDITPEKLATQADISYDVFDLGASIASGSFKVDSMIVIPCSMKTVAGIACGYSDNLLLRAADVTLKERRRLVLVVREAPLSTIHLRNMLELSQMGAIILPCVLSFYNKPQTIADMKQQVIGRALDQLGIESEFLSRWQGG